MNEGQYDTAMSTQDETATAIAQGELTAVNTNLYHQVQSYKELLLDLYSKIESIKPFPPNDTVAVDNNSEGSGLVVELRQTRDYLSKNNELLSFIIQHLDTIV